MTFPADLPEPGQGRWWKIELIPGQASAPLKVSLMEGYAEHQNFPARVLHYTRTTASDAAVRAAAEKVLTAVGDYSRFLGAFLSDAV